MTESIETLDELLNDPMVQLVMASDRVRPDEVRLLFKRARMRVAEPSLPPAHVIKACKAMSMGL